MLAGAVVLWLLVNGLFFYVTRVRVQGLPRRWAEALIIGGGIVFPTIVLAGLLSFGLATMPEQRAPGDGLTVHVIGEQWWWRVHYWPEGADAPIVSANEVRLPAGLRSDIRLEAARVIHSFWIPALGGKIDLIPGRENRTSLEPTKAGVYRGQCAEFCGASHALMAFEAVVMEPDDFDAWLEHIAADAAPPEGDLAQRGAGLFASEGCGGCHTIRGTEAQGNVGPDLTHVGGRLTLAAGVLPNEVEDFARWIQHPGVIKPEAQMPDYAYLSPDELTALGTYLDGLR